MKAQELRRLYIDFFVKKHGHAEIQGAPLIPENDPTVLFTTAGMHPLVPYLMGEKHPSGTRLVDVQKCIRTDDIEEVGDDSHLTFFEMLGNWSLGDYFKEEAIAMSWEFLTEELKLDPERISVSCFAGDDDAPRDNEASEIWKKTGVPGERIHFYGKKENWWGPAGQTGPCGPDTEMFYDTGKEPTADPSEPATDGVKYVEIWNDVFMQYNKTEEGTYEPLTQKNVDTGLGLERVLCIMNGVDSVFETDLFTNSIEKIHELATEEINETSVRIIADHMRAATFILAEGISPSNVDQGYVLRRLLRRAIRHGKKLGIHEAFTHVIAEIVIEDYKEAYPEVERNREFILDELKREEVQFERTLQVGLKEFTKLVDKMQEFGKQTEIPGRKAFNLYDTYGFPIEFTEELAKERGMTVDMDGFEKALKKHQELSRQGAEKKFKGGLADHSEQTTRLHSATHLLHQALRDVLGDHVAQKGSNITAERLRFDFIHPEPMTSEELQEVQRIVNEQIECKLPVSWEEMSVDEAKQTGAIGLFEHKYGEKVKVYSMGDYSKEICGGPHVENTGDIIAFKIKKEQSSSRGVRRIKAIVGEEAK